MWEYHSNDLYCVINQHFDVVITNSKHARTFLVSHIKIPWEPPTNCTIKYGTISINGTYLFGSFSVWELVRERGGAKKLYTSPMVKTVVHSSISKSISQMPFYNLTQATPLTKNKSPLWMSILCFYAPDQSSLSQWVSKTS